MKKVIVFGKQTCPVCKDAFEKLIYFKEKKGFSAPVEYVDMETVDGLAQGAYYEVADIPTVVILDGDKELIRWTKKPPLSEEFIPYLT